MSFKTALQALVATRKYTEPQEELEEEERKLAAAYQRFGELERLTDDAIQNAAQVVKLKMAAEEREELQLKEETLLNAPRMAAEFEHYRPLAYWDMHEATCLLLGKDPRRLKSIVVFHREGRESSIALSDFPHRSPFAARFRDLANVLKRAAETGVIGDEDRIDPSRLIPWALTRGISVPKALVTAFPQPDAGARQELDDGEIESSTAAPPSSSPDMSTAVPRANLEREVSRLKAQLKTEKTANSKWRKTTLLLLYGLLHGTFRGNPREKPASVQDVIDFVYAVAGRCFDANTIRSRLKEIDAMLAEIQTDIDQVPKQENLRGKQNRS